MSRSKLKDPSRWNLVQKCMKHDFNSGALYEISIDFMCPSFAYETRAHITLGKEEATSINMEARLVGKLTTDVETLQKENETLKGTTNEPRNDVEPNNSKHIGSRNVGGKGDVEEEMKNMQNKLRNLKEKYEEMARKKGTLSSVDLLLISTGLPYSE